MNQITTNKENKMNDLAVQKLAHTMGTMKETMSSLEIAKLTGKEHSNVMRDIRAFLGAVGQEKMASEIEAIYTDAYGREKPCYNLPKRECLGLAARYDVNLQMAIIDRWAELETKELANKSPMRIPQTFAEALRLAADAAEAADRAEAARIIAQEQEAKAVLERDQAVEKVQRVVPALLTLKSQQQRKESLMVGHFAKELSDDQGYEIGERRLFALLRERGWICKRSTEPTQKAIEHDYMAVKRSTWKHPTKGEQTSVVPLITTRGQIKLHEILASSGVRKRTQQDVLHSEYNDSFEQLIALL